MPESARVTKLEVLCCTKVAMAFTGIGVALAWA